jgi:hypothetical protein
MNNTERSDNLSGYYTVDCSVRDRNIFYFVLYEDYTAWPASKWNPNSSQGPHAKDIKKRILVWIRENAEDDQWSQETLTGISRLFGESCKKPKPQFVGIAGTDVYSIGSGEKGFEEKIPYFDQGGPFQGSASKARSIDGWLYAAGGGHCVGKRIAKGQWQSFTKKIRTPSEKNGQSHFFRDIDGFSVNDIYCVGDYGYVCHFDGEAWELQNLPTNINLQSVVCAGDGFVYVSGLHGATYKGRGQQWKNLYKGHLETQPLSGMTLGFKDMVWYQDRVWCTSDYGLWTIKDDKLEEADVPGFVNGCVGNLSTADGVLLLAGHGGAAFLENGQWLPIY